MRLMDSRLVRLSVFGLLSSAFTVLGASSASAQSPSTLTPEVPVAAGVTDCGDSDPTTWCNGNSGGGQQGGGGNGGGGGGGKQTCSVVPANPYGTSEVDCTDALGNPWMQGSNCYLHLDDPVDGAPTKDGDGRGEHTYWCIFGDIMKPITVYDGQFVAPITIAEQLNRELNLGTPQIKTVPIADAGHRGLVGLPSWVWVDNQSTQTIGPEITKKGAVPGTDLTVSLTATFTGLRVDFGDGTVITCPGDAPAYTVAAGSATSPTCGHVYDTAGTYTIVATPEWTIHWTTGGGADGDHQGDLQPIGLADSRATVQIGEMQVLNN